MTRLTALMIQNNDVSAEGYAPDINTNLYRGFITFKHHDEECPMILISTEPIYPTAEEARLKMKELIALIKQVNLLEEDSTKPNYDNNIA